jgi:hypothetical protein
MNTTKRKRLPYGNTNFESIRTGNYAYIDKTRYIELLEDDNSYIFFVRPRKFGKSLFLSMLSNYYDINQADKFEQLFGDLYIGKHPTPKHNSYLVLNFDFSGLDTLDEKSFDISFSARVHDSVLDFLKRYEYLLPKGDIYSSWITAEKSGTASLHTAFFAAQAIGKKLYVIIDEYDHFTNDLIAQGTDGDNVYRQANTVLNFYGTLKAGTKSEVDRIIYTGITPVSLNNLISGFNISSNISLEPRYNEMLGFTQDEVNALMEETGIDSSMISVYMEYLYNGYLFHTEGKNRVYNPSSILYLFEQVLKFGDKVENIIDDNLKPERSRLQMLMQNPASREQLVMIAKENAITSQIIPIFSLERLQKNEYFISMLFYMGMLTVDKMEEGLLTLKIPNCSIQTIYREYIKEMIKEDSPDVFRRVDE